MSARVRLVPNAVVAVLALVAGILVVGGAADADEASYEHAVLPLTGVTDMVVDEGRDLVYISGAAGDDRIAVATADGSSVREIVGVTGATQLALNADGTRLYAAVPDGDAIAEVDTETLSVNLLSTGAQTCPNEVAVVRSSVWYAEDAGCNSGSAELRVLDPASGETRDVLGGYPIGAYNSPALRVVPGTDQLLVNSQHVTGGWLDLIDTVTETAVAHEQLNYSPGDIIVAPDGSELAIGRVGWPQHSLSVRRLPDLAETGEIVLPQTWVGTRAAGDGELLVASSDDGRVGVFERSTTTLLNAIRFGGERQSQVSKLALVNGRLVAVAVRGGSVRMYHNASPTVPAPTLSASASAPVVVGHPATLSGTLTAGDSPMAGVRVTVRDESVTIGEAVTDATGAWSVDHTFDVVGTAALLVTAEGTATSKAAVTTLDTNVGPVTSGFEVSAPESVAPGTPIEVQGRLRADGEGVGGASVEWWADCADDYRVPDTTGTVTTAADGSFAVTHDPGACTRARVGVSWDGDATRSSTYASVQVAVTWQRSALAVTTEPEAWVEDAVQASVALTVDGEPVAGQAVQAQVKAPGGAVTDLSGTTASDGTLLVSFPTPQLGDYTLTAARAQTADTLGSTARAVVRTKTVPTELLLSASPSSIVAGESVELSGSLSREDDRNGDTEVQLIATDADGTRRDHFVTTDADGAFSVTDTPAAAGSTRYTARYAGTGLRYQAAADARVDATVAKATPTLTLRTDRRSYIAGQTANLVVDISGSRSRVVRVTARRSAGSTKLLFEGAVPTGGLTLSRHMTHTERFAVTTPADATHASAARELVRGVRLKMTTTAPSPVARRNGWAIYRTSSDPAFNARTTPPRPGACLRFEVQKKTSGGWRTTATSACRTLDDAGRTRWRFDGRRQTKVGYRVRTRFAGDELNLASTSPWALFRFR